MKANDLQAQIYKVAQKELSPWKSKTKFFKMLSTTAAEQIPNQSLDHIYVDSPHDYCGVKQDLYGYYPKLHVQ